VKIQLEQLDLLRPWPAMRLKDGYHALAVLVRLGDVPVGQVLTRPAVRREVLPHRLAKLIARRLGYHLLKLLAREGITAGPEALAGVPAEHGRALQLATSPRKLVYQYLQRYVLLPGGLPAHYATWAQRAAATRDVQTPPVTVAICTRDRAKTLEGCLAQLKQLDYPDYDIMVVDNSAHPVPTRAVAERAGVGYVRVPIAGLSRARNAALKHARCEWVAFTDDDCRPERNWLRELVRPLQNSKCRCVTGLVLPAQLENMAEIAFEVYGGLGRGFREMRYDSLFMNYRRLKPPRTWEIGAGANMLLHADLVLESGGFDEDMGPGAVGGCGEDTDVFYRILRGGHAIHYTPRAIVHHFHRSSPQSLRKQISSYAVGHAAYHWRILFRYRDLRSLLQLVYHLPRWFKRNLRQGMRGKTRYPFSLVFVEARGMLVGPVQYSAVKLRRLVRALPGWVRDKWRGGGPRMVGQTVDDHSYGADTAAPGSKSHRVA
jgi:GT2 family glycosyltransferase